MSGGDYELRKAQFDLKSNCCLADADVVHGKEGTSYWECSACKKACDLAIVRLSGKEKEKGA